VKEVYYSFKGKPYFAIGLKNDSNGRSVTKILIEHRDAKDMNEWLVQRIKKGLGQEAQDVFLLPQKQTCFTPDGRKVKEIEEKCSKSKVGCALFRFYFTLICRNTIKSK
jgi:hypothetical protein